MAHIRNRLGKTAGFTLIEVLIALVVVTVGMAALLQLQSSFIKGATDSEQRAVAMALAEKKLEEFRDYQTIVEFDQIGSAASPTSEVEAVSVGKSSIDYTLNWSGINTVSSAVNASEYKEITVTVSWNGTDGVSSVALSTLLARVDPNLAPLLGVTGFGGDSPAVSHAAGDVPDVIPIDIGDDKTQETSKPLPDVDQSNESTEVRFETVTYDVTTTKLVQQEFVTVNCFCNLVTGSTAGETPHHYKYNDGALEVEQGVTVTTATTGTLYSGGGSFTQSQYCTRCCAGHHDASDTTVYSNDGVPGFKEVAPSTAHKHYKLDPTALAANTITFAGEATAGGDIYAEACRFRRVDGLFELFPDWKLIDLPTIPYNYPTTSAGLASYQQYVHDQVHDRTFTETAALSALGVSALGASLASVDLDMVEGGLSQLLARGLYYDDMSYDDNWIAKMTDVAASSGMRAGNDWLAYTPFFEINMTLLSDWDTENSTLASVTDEEVNTIDDAANFYAVYSRGLVQAGATASGATVQIFAESAGDNTGLLGNRYGTGSSFEGQSNSIVASGLETVSSAIDVNILGSGATIAVTGLIEKGSTGSLTLTSVSVATSYGSCTVSGTGNSRSYECLVPVNYGNVTVYATTTETNEYLDPNVTLGGDIVSKTAGNSSTFTSGNITVSAGTSPIANVNFLLKK
ncbi:type IV pilin [Marinobacterium zhoushanense]|uniref:Type IV pilin n=1 Tax=Marinobacterium zhoushanense TaxID=1679163 RepID=A0ABQ1KQ39_9GAMM|nr:prepilin-type N-terminal cleavage/methylation domain-containing protein [Marinobacterium zhoushanense]GGC03738.1 type IV pilin [Marinobacterium zhoushanense]